MPEGYQPAPLYKVNQLQESYTDLKTTIRDENTETRKLINEFIKEARGTYVTKEELIARDRLIDEKYGPTKKAVWGIGATVLGILVSYAFQLFINLQGGS